VESKKRRMLHNEVSRICELEKGIEEIGQRLKDQYILTAVHTKEKAYLK